PKCDPRSAPSRGGIFRRLRKWRGSPARAARRPNHYSRILNSVQPWARFFVISLTFQIIPGSFPVQFMLPLLSLLRMSNRSLLRRFATSDPTQTQLFARMPDDAKANSQIEREKRQD